MILIRENGNDIPSICMNPGLLSKSKGVDVLAAYHEKETSVTV
jgi:hypothetical protein